LRYNKVPCLFATRSARYSFGKFRLNSIFIYVRISFALDATRVYSAFHVLFAICYNILFIIDSIRTFNLG